MLTRAHQFAHQQCLEIRTTRSGGEKRDAGHQRFLSSSISSFNSEVETALSNVRALHASYLRLVQSSSSSSLRSEAYEELQVALDALDGDLEDLEFSVIAVEESGDRWGVSDGEVRRRRSHLDAVVKEVQVSW